MTRLARTAKIESIDVIRPYRRLDLMTKANFFFFFKIFDTHIQPIFLFSVDGVTSFVNSPVEKVHTYLCKTNKQTYRKLMGVFERASHTMAYEET